MSTTLQCSACYDERVLKWLTNPQWKDGARDRPAFAIRAGMTEALHSLSGAVPEAVWYWLSLLTQQFPERHESLAVAARLSAVRPKRSAIFTLAGRIVSHVSRLRVSP